MRLQGKTALVTGATSGIGEVLAEAFAREGAQVGVVGRNEQRGKQVAARIRAAGGAATFLAADMTSMTDLDHLVKQADETFVLVDILANNAGIYPLGPHETVDEAGAVGGATLRGDGGATAVLPVGALGSAVPV